MADSKTTNSTFQPELLYVIQRYLASGPCHEAAAVLQREIENSNLLPARLDYQGNSHTRTFAEFDALNRSVVPSGLLNNGIVNLLRLLNTNLPQSVSNLVPAIIQKGRQSLLRNIDSIRPKHRILDGLRISNCFPKMSPLHIQTNNQPPDVWQIMGRQLTGKVRKKNLISGLAIPHMKEQHKVLGHLSCVFCILFDRTGQYLFTGADDNLVKVWQVEGARLLFTLRGCTGEITDLSISHENTLLAASSVDRTIRVWCLRSANLVSVLKGHSSMVTSVHFLPYVNANTRFILSTSNDCCVCFWMWNAETLEFESEPTKYSEREKVGAQMICSSHSPSGAFVVTGCTDHYIRVYKLSPSDGIERIFETEAHNDRVDSLRWSHGGLRFASGSKDGTVKLWTYQASKWRHILLDVADTKPKSVTQVALVVGSVGTKLVRGRVTMIAWSEDDSLIVTAASDHILRVWNTCNGHILTFMHGHVDDAFVLECHPFHGEVLLSAAHDGTVIIWDILKGKEMCRHHNSIEGQGFGAIFDATFSPTDPTLAAAVDSHGHLIILRAGGSHKLRKEAPYEQFFHTDYRPVVRDAAGFILDEQTQLAPQLMPPPFLVESNGNPHPPSQQRRVPGREKCPESFLQPVTVSRLVEGEDLDVDVIEIVEANNPQVPTQNGRLQNCPSEDLPLCAWTNRHLVRALKPNEILTSFELRKQLQIDELENFEREQKIPDVQEIDFEGENSNCDSQTISDAVRSRRRDRVNNHVYATRRNNGRARTGRNTSRANINTFPGQGNTIRDESNVSSPPQRSSLASVEEEEDSLSEVESSTGSDVTSDSEYEGTPNNNRNIKSSTRRSNRTNIDRNNSSGEQIEDEDEEPQPSTSTSTANQRPKKKRKASSPIRRKQNANAPPSPNKKRVSYLRARKKCVYEIDGDDIPAYKTEFPNWLMGEQPTKFPYRAQVGDEIVYFPIGHRLYHEAVERHKIYEISPKMRTKNDLEGEEFGLVEEVSYELEPYRLCCLRISQIHATTGNLTGREFKLWYHDVDNIVDFVVLRSHYDKAMAQKWKAGDRFQSLIDDCWWFGNVEKRETFDKEFPRCPFQSLLVSWDNGESERMSPWDLEIFQDSMYAQRKGAELKATPEDYLRVAEWKCNEFDWPIEAENDVYHKLKAAVQQLNEQPYVEDFMEAVDLRQYPTYPACVPCPIDMNTVLNRLNNKFYRRLASVESDIRLMAECAERFNELSSDIVKYSHIFTETLLSILRDSSIDCYETFVHLDEREGEMSFPNLINATFNDTKLKKVPKKKCHKAEEYHQKTANVMCECKQLVTSLLETEDALPFLGDEESPELSDVFDSFMNLSQVRDRLNDNKYKSPEDLANDVNSMLQNVRNIATNKRSRVFKSALKLSSLFTSRMSPLIERWKTLTGVNENNQTWGQRAYNTRVRNNAYKSVNRRMSHRRRVVAQISSDEEIEDSIVKLAPHKSPTLSPQRISRAAAHTSNNEKENNEIESNEEIESVIDADADVLHNQNQQQISDASIDDSDDSDYNDSPRAKKSAPPKSPPKPKPTLRPQLRLKNERQLDSDSNGVSETSDSPPPTPRARGRKRGRSPSRPSAGRNKKVVDYNENSDEAEETICTSSRGRTRKVTKYH